MISWLSVDLEQLLVNHQTTTFSCHLFKMLSKTLQALNRSLPSPTARNLSSSSSVNNATKQQLVNLTVDDKTGIATLELNRPPVNTLNTSLLQDISAALTEVEKNRSKGMILTSVRISILYSVVVIARNYEIS